MPIVSLFYGNLVAMFKVSIVIENERMLASKIPTAKN